MRPHLLSAEHPLAAANGVFNAVMVRGNAVGDVMFYGRGAGDLPTASAVMGDILDALDHRAKRRDLGWSEGADIRPFPHRLKAGTALPVLL